LGREAVKFCKYFGKEGSAFLQIFWVGRQYISTDILEREAMHFCRYFGKGVGEVLQIFWEGRQ
jgi:hypothetical protein